MINKNTARKMYEHYTKRIDELIKAQESLTSGGVKSYKIGDMEITKFDMTKLDELLEELDEPQPASAITAAATMAVAVIPIFLMLFIFFFI